MCAPGSPCSPTQIHITLSKWSLFPTATTNLNLSSPCPPPPPLPPGSLMLPTPSPWPPSAYPYASVHIQQTIHRHTTLFFFNQHLHKISPQNKFLSFFFFFFYSVYPLSKEEKMAKALSYIYVWTEREQAANDNYGGKQKIKTDVSKCSLYTFYNNPAPLNGSTQFHYCTLVTREPEQTMLLFWSAACGVTPHGLHTADWR